MTITYNNIKELRDRLNSIYKGLEGCTLQGTSEAQISAAFVSAGIETRDQYIAWVKFFKSTIKYAAQIQRTLRRLAREGDDSSASWRDSNKALISRAIEARRMSRIAAKIASQKERHKQTA